MASAQYLIRTDGGHRVRGGDPRLAADGYLGDALRDAIFGPTTSGGPIAVGLAIETDTALAESRRKARALGLATETDASVGAAPRKARAVGLAVETETALALPRRKAKAAGIGASTESALAAARRKARAIGRADETDTAIARPSPTILSAPVGLAVETDTALPLQRAGQQAVGHGTERRRRSPRSPFLTPTTSFYGAPDADVVWALPVGMAVEHDQALALAGRKDYTKRALALLLMAA